MTKGLRDELTEGCKNNPIYRFIYQLANNSCFRGSFHVTTNEEIIELEHCVVNFVFSFLDLTGVALILYVFFINRFFSLVKNNSNYFLRFWVKKSKKFDLLYYNYSALNKNRLIFRNSFDKPALNKGTDTKNLGCFFRRGGSLYRYLTVKVRLFEKSAYSIGVQG